MNIFNYKNNKGISAGFALAEILVACAIISVTTFSLLSASSKGVQLSQRSLRQAQANLLLEEGAEAVRSIRDNAWSNISSLNVGTIYYLSFSTNNNSWSLSTTPSVIENVFTRTVVFSNVNRDASDDIVNSGGTLDSGTKKVTIEVTFPGSNGFVSKSLSLYLADIFTQ